MLIPNKKQLFLNSDLRSGGFYELSIQVCKSKEIKPIELYTDYIWSLKNVEGPFDREFNKIKSDVETFGHEGLIHIDPYLLPFSTFNIREGWPDSTEETSYNWFDVSFYTNVIEQLCGDGYRTWDTDPKSPKAIDGLFTILAQELYAIYPFSFALLGFEVSGEYSLKNLQTKPLDPSWNPHFFMGKENYETVLEENKKFITILE